MTSRLSRREAMYATFALFAPFTAGCERSRRGLPGSTTATRMVSLGPATTEALFAIGAGPRVVGRSRFCDKPKEALSLPSVGGYTDPNLEAILALQPDLVTGVRGPAGSALVLTLEERVVRTYFPETESRGQIISMIRGLGERTGCATGADVTIAKLEAELAQVRAAVASRAHPRALLIFGRSPLVAAGTGSFSDEMLTLAGLTNAVVSRERYPALEVERVLAMDPDVILDASMEGEDATYFAAGGWPRVRAVREKRVLRVADTDVLRPGPSVAKGVATLARMVHGTSGMPGLPGTSG